MYISYTSFSRLSPALNANLLRLLSARAPRAARFEPRHDKCTSVVLLRSPRFCSRRAWRLCGPLLGGIRVAHEDAKTWSREHAHSCDALAGRALLRATVAVAGTHARASPPARAARRGSPTTPDVPRRRTAAANARRRAGAIDRPTGPRGTRATSTFSCASASAVPPSRRYSLYPRALAPRAARRTARRKTDDRPREPAAPTPRDDDERLIGRARVS